MPLPPETLKEHQRRIRLLILDVDGVLTDGSLFLGDAGEEYKAFNSRDGHGIRMAQQGGLELAILTGRSSEVVLHRMRDLGVEHILQGRREKGDAVTELLAQSGYQPEHAAFVGDDVVDLPAMRRVSLGIAVADAHPLVLENAHWVTAAPGGRGAVREICEQLLAARGSLEKILDAYLRH
ncbi:3-deoxy-D-manno-octulosonate 8-phosphate phosphatase [Thioalkalivibrio nitratireducens DSM 14787]|uniref:3-deoxy-D-manno-octulosonate 8-phosphate phosphatase KdsC n=1 Tax=Thioalkalivibrio nitratireducens (strain DSM 14787 / UNIQEM 213 / ALEN2) TaxID=1255043 RepID=L0DXG2_THIND|nr:HAD hydrolase family protein [Thioalkalivibrio nitratireducens]AGA34279.1 3-deoxy-D-manno-octulosonate 8-phosphate phosphatase [Thioalkalivibrio nitratireducens DSM 14787]